MNDATSTWIGLKLVGSRYLVTEKLAQSGMGAVYRATDRRLGTGVMIEVPHGTIRREPEFAQCFTRAIQSPVKFFHPHDVQVQDVGQHAGIPFAVMQFLAGGKAPQPKTCL